MDNFTSNEWQQLIIALIDVSYQPFVILYPIIWAWAILQRMMQVL